MQKQGGLDVSELYRDGLLELSTSSISHQYHKLAGMAGEPVFIG